MMTLMTGRTKSNKSAVANNICLKAGPFYYLLAELNEDGTLLELKKKECIGTMHVFELLSLKRNNTRFRYSSYRLYIA